MLNFLSWLEDSAGCLVLVIIGAALLLGLWAFA